MCANWNEYGTLTIKDEKKTKTKKNVWTRLLPWALVCQTIIYYNHNHLYQVEYSPITTDIHDKSVAPYCSLQVYMSVRSISTSRLHVQGLKLKKKAFQSVKT